MFVAHGIEYQPWNKEIMKTDISSSLFQDNMVDSLLSLREISKVYEVAFDELLPVTNEDAFVKLFFVLRIVGEFLCK
jgi:hypothetical protein